MVGGQRAGVSAADHDDVSALGGHCCLLSSRVCCPQDTAATAGVTAVETL
jgi:hypothetical protein